MAKRPIEEMFPIENLNEIAEREAQAKMYYRPPLTIHKWWARRLGSIFRAICIYSLIHEDADVEVTSGNLNLENVTPEGNEDLDSFLKGGDLWPVFTGEVEVDIDATVLDPMMGGGTTILESLLLGCDVIGSDLNPVAWFIVKKMVEPVDIDELEKTYEALKDSVAEEIKKYYKTTCPECDDNVDVLHYFWVHQLDCENCNNTVRLFKDWHLRKDENLVLCPDCGDIFEGQLKEGSEQIKSNQKCSNCKTNFNARKGNITNNGNNYRCPNCGQTYEIVEAADKQGYSSKLFGLEYYCDSCDSRGYKSVEEKDKDLYSKAERSFENKKDELLFPDQKRPKGHSDRAIPHGFNNFKNMFNKRQLLCLSKLLQSIQEIDDKNVKELLLLAFSEALEYNNLFCGFKRTGDQRGQLFKTKTLTVRHVISENNIWGGKYGTGSFIKRYNRVLDAKKFLNNPYQKYLNKKGEKKERKISSCLNIEIANEFNEFKNKNKNCLLLCRSSDYMPLPDKEFEAIITDPPYYDNVMYSEHSDFFYVWLRLLLKESYDHFRSELTPRTQEAIVNPMKDERFSFEEKTEEEYIKDLTRIFKESNRILKKDGLMVFTFHHKESTAWSSVLKAVLNADFYVKATYPIHSEMSTSTHVYEKQNISYDTIVVCRKREEEGKETSWRRVEDRIYSTAKKTIEEYEEKNGAVLSLPDVGVVTKGKCLEVYSQHYPNVIDENEEKVEVEEAVSRISEIVDQQLIEERIQKWSDKTDKLSSIFFIFFSGKDSIKYDEIHRQLQGRSTSPDDFTDNRLVEQDGKKLRVLSPGDRIEYIKDTKAENRLVIDKIHYLQYLLKSDEKSLKDESEKWLEQDNLRDWIDERVVSGLNILKEITEDESYEKLLNHVEIYFDKIPQKKISRF